MFSSSVVSYPERGNYGNSLYRGNTTGKIIIDLIENFLPTGGLFVDPSIGGGTSVDVVNHLKVERFVGLDLHSGFNLLRDDLLSTLGGVKADLTFYHPPYGGMIKYSGKGNMWGDQPHPDDMSHMSDADFENALKLALVNISDCTKDGGIYAVLIGNQRKQGRYINWSSKTEELAPDPLIDEVIKVQHNCVSDARQYARPLIRIAHEKLLIFRKDAKVNAVSSFAQSLIYMNEGFSSQLLVTMKRMFQCREWSQQELLDALEPLAQSTPYDLYGAIVSLLNSKHFVLVAGRYRLA